jgi:hypothetical protein
MSSKVNDTLDKIGLTSDAIKAKMTHEFYKQNPDKREHSFSLTYAKKAVNEAEKNLEIAKKLWA